MLSQMQKSLEGGVSRPALSDMRHRRGNWIGKCYGRALPAGNQIPSSGVYAAKWLASGCLTDDFAAGNYWSRMIN
ncbi:MAG: hypothetical protein ACRD9L_13675 [Bryobacteraceae bacterium]